MKKYPLLFLLLLLLATACNSKPQTEESGTDIDANDFCCTDPVCVLMVQPYDDFSQTEAQQLAKKVKTEIERMTAVMVT